MLETLRPRSSDRIVKPSSTSGIRAVLRATTPPELPNAEPRIDAAAGSALLIAALRELFEEAGILIACTGGGLPVDAALVRSENVQRARNSIGSGEPSFAEFLIRKSDWFRRCTRAGIVYSHWITPRGEPRRYNTYFFFALAPPGQAGPRGRSAKPTRDCGSRRKMHWRVIASETFTSSTRRSSILSVVMRGRSNQIAQLRRRLCSQQTGVDDLADDGGRRRRLRNAT